MHKILQAGNPSHSCTHVHRKRIKWKVLLFTEVFPFTVNITPSFWAYMRRLMSDKARSFSNSTLCQKYSVWECVGFWVITWLWMCIHDITQVGEVCRMSTDIWLSAQHVNLNSLCTTQFWARGPHSEVMELLLIQFRARERRRWNLFQLW